VRKKGWRGAQTRPVIWIEGNCVMDCEFISLTHLFPVEWRETETWVGEEEWVRARSCSVSGRSETRTISSCVVDHQQERDKRLHPLS
jgi:hypothetical protein